MKQITFQKNWGIYFVGDVAVFDDKTADDLIRRGGATDNGPFTPSNAPSLEDRILGRVPAGYDGGREPEGEAITAGRQ